MLSKCFVVFFSMAVLADAYQTSDMIEWNSFKKKHSKHYDTLADEIHHFQIYVTHKHHIDEHNMHHENGVASFKMGLNRYSDLTHEEFIKTMNGYKSDEDSIDYDDEPTFLTESDDVNLPKSVDWRHEGAVTAVRNQEDCGSCYAMSVVGAVESRHFIKTGHLLTLSPQNIVDCSKPYGNFGCDGGEPMSAMKYMQDNGVYTEQSYPYYGYEHRYCKLGARKSNVIVKGFTRIPKGNEMELQKALTHGPVAVAIDASHRSFMHYNGELYYEPACSTEKLDHAVLLVGYGTDEYNRDYYIAKNSYGRTWGDQGYFRIPRNHRNHCGVATEAIYPIV